MKPAKRSRVFWISLCSLCLCGSNAFSASPRDELLRLVPDDAGLCLLVQDLRGTIERLQSSPFAGRLANSPVGRSFRASPEARQLASINEQLTRQLGISAQELRDEVLGDAIAFAYTPGPPEKPEQEKGLLLVHARRPDRLADLLARLNDQQKQSGELKLVETGDAGGHAYTIRRKSDGDEFYAISGSIFILSNSESRLTGALNLSRQTPANGEPTVQLRQLQALGVESNPLVFWINPRAFDVAVGQAVKGAAATDAGGMKTFAECWRALDGAAITVRLDDGADLALSLRGRADELPAGIRRFVDNARRPAPLWSAFPEGALLKVATRVPWEPADPNAATAPAKPSLNDVWQRGIGSVLGRDMLPELLRYLGPDWGVCVERPDAGSPGSLPSFTAALRLRGDSPTARQRVLGGLDVIARLAVLSMNARWKVGSSIQDDVTVHFIDGGKTFPPGIQPAFAWKGGYIVLASSPDLIRRFQPPTVTDPPATTEQLPLLQLSFVAWADYLRSYRVPLVEFIAESHKLDRVEVQKQLDGLLESLELFDKLEVMQRVASGRATLTMRLRTSQPLRN